MYSVPVTHAKIAGLGRLLLSIKVTILIINILIEVFLIVSQVHHYKERGYFSMSFNHEVYVLSLTNEQHGICRAFRGLANVTSYIIHGINFQLFLIIW